MHSQQDEIMSTDIRGWPARGAKQTRTPARANPNDLFPPLPDRQITGRPFDATIHLAKLH
jgi:hypothetical protein